MEILPDRCSAIAKKELVYAGTVGLICWLGGIVFINRKKTSDAKSVMADTAKVMLNDQVTGWFLILYIVMAFSVCHFRGILNLSISNRQGSGMNTTFFFNPLKLLFFTDPSVGVPRGNPKPERRPAALQKRRVPSRSTGTSQYFSFFQFTGKGKKKKKTSSFTLQRTVVWLAVQLPAKTLNGAA